MCAQAGVRKVLAVAAAALALWLALACPVLAAEASGDAAVQITVTLPEDWSGTEFWLTNDTGLAESTCVVEEGGKLTVSAPESSYCVLTPADASVQVPDPPKTAATSDLIEVSPESDSPATIFLNLGSSWAGVVFRTFSDQKFTPAFIAVDSDGVLRVNIDYGESCNIACLVLSEEEFQALSADDAEEDTEASTSFSIVKPGVLMYLAGLGVLAAGCVGYKMWSKNRT